MNHQNATLQMKLLGQTFAARYGVPAQRPPKFVAAPRPAPTPNRAPKPAPRLPWRLRNLLSLLKLAVKVALLRIARWRPALVPAAGGKPAAGSICLKMSKRQRRRERRAALTQPARR